VANRKKRKEKSMEVRNGVPFAAPLDGAAKEAFEAAQAADISLLAGLNDNPSFEWISNDAIDYAVENGLKMPLSAKVSAAYYGYSVEVTELAGKFRSSNIRYTRQGKRQMYEMVR
jgi:hypothetical protein